MDVWMHDTDEGITVLPIHLSGVKSDENFGGNRVFLQESGLLQNVSLFPYKLFLVRMRAAILQDLADTGIREAIECCIHVLRVI